MNTKSVDLKLIANADREQKREILRFLTDSRPELDKRELFYLIEALEKEESQAIKERIYLLLKKLLPESSFDILEKMLRSDDPFTRNAAVEMLKASSKCPTSHIKWLARDKDKDVRKLAIDAISSDKSPEAIAIIRERLNDDEINIVTTAVEYLGNVEDKESARDIEKLLLESENKFLQCSCLEALSKIGISPNHRKIIDRFSKDTDPLINFSYLRYVAEFGTETNLETISELMGNHPGLLVREALDAIEKIVTRHNVKKLPSSLQAILENIIENTDKGNQKYQALKILSQVGDKGLREKVRDMINSDDEMLRLSAIEILADCGVEEDIELLEAVAEDAEDGEVLEAIGDAVIKIQNRIESQ